MNLRRCLWCSGIVINLKFLDYWGEANSKEAIALPLVSAGAWVRWIPGYLILLVYVFQSCFVAMYGQISNYTSFSLVTHN